MKEKTEHQDLFGLNFSTVIHPLIYIVVRGSNAQAFKRARRVTLPLPECSKLEGALKKPASLQSFGYHAKIKFSVLNKSRG